MGQWLRPCLPMQGVGTRLLIGELRFHMHHGQKKKKSRSTIVINSIKTKKKVVHMKKKSLKGRGE